MSVPHGELSREEEGGFPPLLREIHFDRTRHMSVFILGDDENTTRSELSTLRTPSTMTRTYDPDLSLGFPLASIGSTRDIGRARRAFQVTALIGSLFVGVIFGADLAFMHSGKDASHIDLLHLPRESDEPEGREMVRKRAKAKKNKAGKQRDEQNASHADEVHEGVILISEDAHVATPDNVIATVAADMMPAEPQVATPRILDEGNSSAHPDVPIPAAHKRCMYVIGTFEEQNKAATDMGALRAKYLAQSVDPNVFYRATARLFWQDFGAGHWGREQRKSINLRDLVSLGRARYADGSPLSPKSTETWITGDQHLSNFGAWSNRGGEVVFSVNHFAEGAMFDFHIDVLRVAVSICNHGFTNGLTVEQVKEALEEFAYTYAQTAIDYVGGDTELLYELTETTSTGILQNFLAEVNRLPREKLMHKFTEVGSDGVRRFVRNENTCLEDASPEMEEKIRAEMTSARYGSTMLKMGWKVHGWDDDFFSALDVARRRDAGAGSYGAERFYVLLKGDAVSVVLDVKFAPESAVSSILGDMGPDEKAWYETLFRNEADRAAKAQRSLTSYTDPYVGYLIIDGSSYTVRERSPYKKSFDLETLTDPREFNEFIKQVAIATATAHVRGTVAKSPGQFKHVIKTLLAGGRSRCRWAALMVKIALSYRHQVLLDFECFQQYVETMFPLEN